MPAPRQSVARDVIATRPTSRPAMVPAAAQQVSMPEVQPVRGFGATAFHDEAMLDIPAYLRRSKP
jgi:hypothetical protein